MSPAPKNLFNPRSFQMGSLLIPREESNLLLRISISNLQYLLYICNLSGMLIIFLHGLIQFTSAVIFIGQIRKAMLHEVRYITQIFASYELFNCLLSWIHWSIYRTSNLSALSHCLFRTGGRKRCLVGWRESFMDHFCTGCLCPSWDFCDQGAHQPDDAPTAEHRSSRWKPQRHRLWLNKTIAFSDCVSCSELPALWAVRWPSSRTDVIGGRLTGPSLYLVLRIRVTFCR